jgi:hypothetical protein
MSLRRILGTIQPGQGDASKNCQRMIGAAAVHCPEIADYGLFGTINVQLDEPFDKTRADCWTPKLVWVPISFNGTPWDQKTGRLEEFGFVRIGFEYPLDNHIHGAWIIMPSGHPYSYCNQRPVEVIAAELIGDRRVQYYSRCAIRLNHNPAIPRPVTFGDNWLSRAT